MFTYHDVYMVNSINCTGVVLVGAVSNESIFPIMFVFNSIRKTERIPFLIFVSKVSRFVTFMSLFARLKCFDHLYCCSCFSEQGDCKNLINLVGFFPELGTSALFFC